MSAFDEYRITINELQRRLILRALTLTMHNDRRHMLDEGLLSRPTQAEWMQLLALFTNVQPSLRKPGHLP
jgi:hypothetical protein